jgi:phosphoesterase RecJ-like protein
MVMDFQKAVELIGKSNKVLITTHMRPDGDACGCIAAISETLNILGKNAKVLLLSEPPQWYQFLFEQRPEIFGRKTKIDSDLIIIVDTATYNQLPEFDKYLKQTDKPVLILDHHATSDNIGNCHLIDSSAAATGLIVFELLKHAGWPISEKIAEAIFVAVSTDTGWFQFDNTDSRALKVCAELIDAGIKPAKVYHDLFQNFSPQRFKLMIAMLNTLELHLGGRFAMQYLTQADFKKTGAKLNDTENLIDECRRINSVKAAALFVEQTDGKVKVSLRSRGAINVCEIAEKFGGGGHKMAAGAHLPGPLEKAKKLILTEMTNRLK